MPSEFELLIERYQQAFPQRRFTSETIAKLQGPGLQLPDTLPFKYLHTRPGPDELISQDVSHKLQDWYETFITLEKGFRSRITACIGRFVIARRGFDREITLGDFRQTVFDVASLEKEETVIPAFLEIVLGDTSPKGE